MTLPCASMAQKCSRSEKITPPCEEQSFFAHNDVLIVIMIIMQMFKSLMHEIFTFFRSFRVDCSTLKAAWPQVMSDGHFAGEKKKKYFHVHILSPQIDSLKWLFVTFRLHSGIPRSLTANANVTARPFLSH